MVEKQTRHSIKALRSDRGGKYLSGEFLNLFKDKGIIFEWTPPYTPQLNGVAKTRNHTLLNMVRSMISFTDLSISFCRHILETTAHILNKILSKSLSSTPYELWNG